MWILTQNELNAHLSLVLPEGTSNNRKSFGGRNGNEMNVYLSDVFQVRQTWGNTGTEVWGEDGARCALYP